MNAAFVHGLNAALTYRLDAPFVNRLPSSIDLILSSARSLIAGPHCDMVNDEGRSCGSELAREGNKDQVCVGAALFLSSGPG
jgi:hypothetical protein